MTSLKYFCCLAVSFLLSGRMVGHNASGSVAEDSLQSYVERVSQSGLRYPQEVVFVHMDNTCYFLGDTLYYKAYVTRSDRGTPSDISRVLYVDLLNQDGYLAERQTLRLRNGQAAGTICLHDTLYAGYYELRAYTRWQLNWGTTEHPHSDFAEKWFLRPDMAKDFFRDYEKLYSRVFPLYDKPQQEGSYDRTMTLRPLRRYSRIKPEKPEAEVGLYPEGGSLIEGGAQRIAFEANSMEGERLDGQLRIYDSKHNVVAEGRTVNRGRGVVEMACQPGESYTAEFLWGTDNVARAEFPKVEKKGAVMRVGQSGGQFHIGIRRQGLGQEPLGLTLMMNGIVRHSEAKVDGEQLTLDTSDLPDGVAQLTLFDHRGRVLADRLTFVRHDSLRLSNVRVTGLPTKGEPFAPVTLHVEAPQAGTVSVAVRDKALSDPVNDNGTMLTELLLGSQIRGFVEDPLYYFEADDEERRTALDLLLMVQGWRRFRWEDQLAGPTVTEPFEQFPVIRGDVSRYDPLDQEDYFYTQTMDAYRLMLMESRMGTSKSKKKASGGSSGPNLREPLALMERKARTGETKITTYLGNNMTEDMTSEPEEPQGHPFLEDLPVLKGPRKAYANDTILYSTTKADPSEFQSLASLKGEVKVRAEFVQPGAATNGTAALEAVTNEGNFALQGPHSNHPYYMYLAAYQKAEPTFSADADDYPDYSVRIRPFHPRYVAPYSYYQEHLRSEQGTAAGQRIRFEDGTGQMSDVVVGGNRNGLRALDLSKPVLVVDAYDAFNQTVDAGLSPAWYAGALSFVINVARLYIGEMGVKRSYDLERRWDGKNFSQNMTPYVQHRYNHLQNLYRVVLYSDYAPRREGDRRYQAADQPSVTVNLEPLPDDGQRRTSRDRRYVQPGYNVCEDFYHPRYETRPLPEVKDYRRTLYWKPDLKLDERGQATVTFYNNGRENEMSVSLEGLTEKGQILSGDGISF